MGLLNSALQIGRTALLSYEGALHVVGSNISGAGSPDYTRLSPQLDPLQGAPITGALQPGAGVALTEIQRAIDETLEGRIRLAIGAEASASTQADALARIEPLLDESNQGSIGARLSRFFRSFGELQNTPEDPAIRDLAVNDASLLVQSINELRAELEALSEDVDKQIVAAVENADAIAREIARLNEEITRAEVGGRGEATGLRDQRDALLRELSQLFDVAVREQPNGTVNVYVGSEVLVQGSSVRGLVAVQENEGDAIRTSIRFADSDQQVSAQGGWIEGLVLSRDRHQQIAALDELAAGIISEVNRLHADGQGLVGYQEVTGLTALARADVALDDADAGLTQVPGSGSFFITVTDDASGTPVAFRVDVDLDGTDRGTTLDSLVADFNSQVEGVTASVTLDNRLQFTADDGFSFTFGHDGQERREDTSGVLAALGINTLFGGSDARTMTLNDAMREEPSLLAAASVFLPGDGDNAGRLAALDIESVEALGGVSLLGYYRSMANSVALNAASTRDNLDAASSVLISLQAQRESISGVNLDEEAISLVKYERAFQSTSRFIRVVDDLISELVTLVR